MERQTPKPLEVVRPHVHPHEIAIQYLTHELIKLFPDRSKTFCKEIEKGTEDFPQSLGEKDFWQLVGAFSETYKLKSVYRILTDPSYSWSLERVRLDDITLTGMSPLVDAITEQAERIPSKFAEIWRQHPEYANSPDGKGIGPEPHRDQFPVMLREKSHCLGLFDGMRRACVAALEGKPDLLAWVGRITGPDDQSAAKAPERHSGFREKIKAAMKAVSARYGRS